MSAEGFQRIDVEEREGAVVARFRDKKILEDQQIKELGADFGRLNPSRRTVLSFAGVKFFSSAGLGKLITLRRKINSGDGMLRLCSLDPDVMDAFKIAKLDDYFDIRPDEQAAHSAGVGNRYEI